MPPGADAVVMQEDTDSDVQPGTVRIKDKVRPFENVRLRGEEIKTGTEVIPAGTKLNAAKIGLLGAVGVGQIKVSKRPTRALLATGSELVEPETKLAPGKIFESNRQMLSAALVRAGAIPTVFPLVPDTPGATRDALERGFGRVSVL